MNLNLNEISKFCSEIILGCPIGYDIFSSNQSELDKGWDVLY